MTSVARLSGMPVAIAQARTALRRYVQGIRVKFLLQHRCRLCVIAAPGGPLQSGTATLTAVLVACGTLGCDG
jgi:hypothetical protein